MPVTYRIDSARRTVFSFATGELTFSDALEFHRQLLADPAYDPAFNELADMSGMLSSPITSDEMRTLGSMRLFSAKSKRAFVAPNPLVFGLTRMYEAHQAAQFEHGIRTFEQLSSARTWLGLSDDSP